MHRVGGTDARLLLIADFAGLIRSIGALLFPVGLVMIVLSGSDLVSTLQKGSKFDMTSSKMSKLPEAGVVQSFGTKVDT